MAHYGILGNTAVSDAGEDIRGVHLYGKNDEKLGKIDDVIFDHSTAEIRYVVVDTGGWLTSKKFIVPAERLQASAKHQNDFEIDLSKKQVETFPAYNESDLESESKMVQLRRKIPCEVGRRPRDASRGNRSQHHSYYLSNDRQL